ncbi:uncharacterized protein LOC116612444 [Nematostella vectensis]|uniref:uncharacterized protein LOC116612444 n=1 Tax=Nematostella vectensis TaxID=45351 RepID=UPI002077016C|nr:uncharacterized protein LOC116612444 [Nematostella vectensis]
MSHTPSRSRTRKQLHEEEEDEIHVVQNPPKKRFKSPSTSTEPESEKECQNCKVLLEELRQYRMKQYNCDCNPSPTNRDQMPQRQREPSRRTNPQEPALVSQNMLCTKCKVLEQEFNHGYHIFKDSAHRDYVPFYLEAKSSDPCSSPQPGEFCPRCAKDKNKQSPYKEIQGHLQSSTQMSKAYYAPQKETFSAGPPYVPFAFGEAGEFKSIPHHNGCPCDGNNGLSASLAPNKPKGQMHSTGCHTERTQEMPENVWDPYAFKHGSPAARCMKCMGRSIYSCQICDTCQY